MLLSVTHCLPQCAKVNEISTCRLLKKISEARRAKIDERRRTLQYVDAKSVERNEAYESFSAAC